MYLWIKTLHIIFVIAWSVGIFYLPRIFVHYLLAKSCQQSTVRIEIMANNLFRFATVMMLLTFIFGLMLVQYQQGLWLHVKLLLVLLLFVYHIWSYLTLIKMRKNELSKSVTYYKIMNELPVLIILAIVYLVVFKPF